MPRRECTELALLRPSIDPNAEKGLVNSTVVCIGTVEAAEWQEGHWAAACAWASVKVDTPWRCLCLGLRAQITYSLLLRRTIVQAEQIF
jgi:hypothetical protein